jgi:hypothetical protein
MHGFRILNGSDIHLTKNASFDKKNHFASPPPHLLCVVLLSYIYCLCNFSLAHNLHTLIKIICVVFRKISTVCFEVHLKGPYV